MAQLSIASHRRRIIGVYRTVQRDRDPVRYAWSRRRRWGHQVLQLSIVLGDSGIEMPEGDLRLVTRRSDILLRADEKFLQHAGEFEQAWPQVLKQLSQTSQGRRYRLLTGGIREAMQRSTQLP